VLSNEVNMSDYVRGDAVAVEMRHATERALALEPNLAAAHGAKGMIYLTLEWDWAAGAAESQKAYHLDPTERSNATVLGGLLWGLHGASDTVLALYEKAIELHPVNANCHEIHRRLLHPLLRA
jgi:tetratricopeptide (TPR) repeat protein